MGNDWLFTHSFLDYFSIFKVFGFDHVAKLLKQLIDDLLAKNEVQWDQVAAIVRTRELKIGIRKIFSIC